MLDYDMRDVSMKEVVPEGIVGCSHHAFCDFVMRIIDRKLFSLLDMTGTRRGYN